MTPVLHKVVCVVLFCVLFFSDTTSTITLYDTSQPPCFSLFYGNQLITLSPSVMFESVLIFFFTNSHSGIRVKLEGK